jgi:hypothetical protein
VAQRIGVAGGRGGGNEGAAHDASAEASARGGIGRIMHEFHGWFVVSATPATQDDGPMPGVMRALRERSRARSTDGRRSRWPS